MSAIASTLRRRWVEIAWAVFAAANVGVIVLLGRWETIPFHFVWVSLSLLYGARVWGLRNTVLVLLVVTLATGAALLWTVSRGNEPFDEVAEVPLMAAMFVAMVWHARRSQAATEEMRRMAEAEHRLLERQREFVRDASHELRTPITVARGHAELIRAAGSGGKVAEDADVVLDELSRMSRLSERLLILAASEDPGFLSLGSIRVEDLLTGMLRRWSPAASRRWELDAGARGTVRADRERLEIALDALIDNAVNATGDGDRIALACRPEGDGVLLEVWDEGMGIGAEHLPRIFERFSRADVDRGRGSGGTGLGLAIVRAIAEAHGGSVAVESVAGVGAKFQIQLPGFVPAPARPSAAVLVRE